MVNLDKLFLEHDSAMISYLVGSYNEAYNSFKKSAQKREIEILDCYMNLSKPHGIVEWINYAFDPIWRAKRHAVEDVLEEKLEILRRDLSSSGEGPGCGSMSYDH